MMKSDAVQAGSVVVGVSGARQSGAAAIHADGGVRAVCERERITRVRRAGFDGGLSDEFLSGVLQTAGNYRRSNVRLYASGEDLGLPEDRPHLRLDHHHAHAATAFYLSPFDSAAVLVCDSHPSESMSVWIGNANGLVRQPWPESAIGLASLYSRCSRLFGMPAGQEHELEALARLGNGEGAGRFAATLTYDDGVLRVLPQWETIVGDWLADAGHDVTKRAGLASAFQRHLATLLLAKTADIRKATGERHLCLGGGLFYNTSFNTSVSESGVFEHVFVAPNPGNAGTAVGAAIVGARQDGDIRRESVSPFLGPGFDVEDIKRTLDNCKLSYECVSEREVIDIAVDALLRGQLVGWFQGRMEWAHRALGNRSILANPLSPWVLDNLNRFLKHRQPYRTYGVSVPEEELPRWFEGPPASRYMEFEYRPTFRDRFHLLPAGVENLRVQTIPAAGDGSPTRYRLLHQAFANATGVPVLVNTSFNGFSEPIVCSPRDAIRVFFGTGLDILVLDRFILRK